MSLYTLIIVTFVIFMAINVIIGLRGRKHASTTKDFLTASGQSGIWFIIASAVGASIGSGVVIGTTQYAVKLGVAGAWYAIACGLACVVHAFVMTRFIYRNKLVSFSDYFKRRYDSNFHRPALQRHRPLCLRCIHGRSAGCCKGHFPSVRH